MVKARKERMQETATRASLMEAKRRKILTKLGKRPVGETSTIPEEITEEELLKRAQQEEEGQDVQIENVDLPEDITIHLEDPMVETITQIPH